MREDFSEYYSPTDREFARMWEEALIVLDANVLLNIYRYSDEAREPLLNVLQALRDRVWVPHQAAREYQENRLSVISQQQRAYEEIDDAVDKCNKQLADMCRRHKRHAVLDHSAFSGVIDEAFRLIRDRLQAARAKHPDLVQKDVLRDRLTDLLNGRVGARPSEQDLPRLIAEGKERYEKLIPPGYLDAQKDGDRAFGDWLLWHQVLVKAKDMGGRPVILVSDDTKEDWWWRHEGGVIGPLPQLRAEMKASAGSDFYMYRMDQFIKRASSFLKTQVERHVLEEMRAVQERLARRAEKLERVRTERAMRLRELFAEREALTAQRADVLAELRSLDEHVEHFIRDGMDSTRDMDVVNRMRQTLRMRLGEIEKTLEEMDIRIAGTDERMLAREAALERERQMLSDHGKSKAMRRARLRRVQEREDDA